MMIILAYVFSSYMTNHDNLYVTFQIIVRFQVKKQKYRPFHRSDFNTSQSSFYRVNCWKGTGYNRKSSQIRNIRPDIMTDRRLDTEQGVAIVYVSLSDD